MNDINKSPYTGTTKYYIIDLSCPLVMNVQGRMNAYILSGDAVSDVTSLLSVDHSGYTISTCPLFQIEPPSPPFPKRSKPSRTQDTERERF